MQVNVSAASSSNTIGAGGGGDVAQLQAKLKLLLNRVKDLAKDTAMDARLKKMMQQSLQAQIQLVTKQIADVQSKPGKSVTADNTLTVRTLNTQNKSAQDRQHPASPGGIDTFA